MVIYGINGGVAQLARARGSYPRCRRFESYRRYHLSADSLNGKTTKTFEASSESRRKETQFDPAMPTRMPVLARQVISISCEELAPPLISYAVLAQFG